MTKEEVLSLLLTAGEPVSGEHICRQLGVTRAAVWKAIDQLRQEGYTIEAAPRRGYTLTARPDRLDTAQVRGYLAGHPWQPLVTAVERVDSTNNACTRLAAEGAPDGTAVLTGMQTAGRGRRGRTFVSPPGGLYFSLILRPHAQPEALMHLTAMVAVAAARAIERVSGVYPGIKWTNDLVLGKKKLCGILTEIGIEAESREVDYAVVGIGINCAHAELPPEVAAMSADLETATGKKPDRSRLAAELVRSLYEMEQALFTQKDAWLAEFSAHCVTIGQDVKLVRGDEVQFAHADGIDGEAALRVTCEADVETLPPDAMIDRPYDNQDDLFSLNEWKLEELKQRFTPSLALSAVPFVLQMPLGALSDALGFLYSNGFLAFLGLE